MKIAVRKQENGSIYVDKYSCYNSKLTEEQLKSSPYNYNIVEVADMYNDCSGSDFNDDLTFSVEKYNARKEKEKGRKYEALVVAKIRMVYTIDQELALLRQRDSKFTEFNDYNEYVEKCKAEAKKEVGYGI